MRIDFDQLRRSKAEGNTVAYTVYSPASTTSAINTSYPISNCYDATSEATQNEGFYLSKYAQFTIGDDSVNTNSIGIKIDLGEAKSVWAGLISGFDYSPDATDLAAPDILLEYSSDDASYTTFKSITRAHGSDGKWEDVYESTNTRNVALIGAAAVSARYWRLTFDPAAAGSTDSFIRVGYFSVYGDGLDLGAFSFAPSQVSLDVEGHGVTGTPFIVRNGKYNEYQISLPQQTGDIAAQVLQLTENPAMKFPKILRRQKLGTIGGGFFDPAQWPIVAMFATDITDTDADDQVIKRSLFSSMVTIRRSLAWQFGPLAGSQPQVNFSICEWVG